MDSPWDRDEPESVEIEVDSRPPRDRATAAARPGSGTPSSVDHARQAVRVLEHVAWVIPVVSVLGYILTSFWTDEVGIPDQGTRQRIGGLLTFVWVPLALGALVYATSLLLTLYAARLELDARRPHG